MNISDATNHLSGKLLFANPDQIAAARLLQLAGELNAAITQHPDRKARCKPCDGAGYIHCDDCNGDGAVSFKGALPADKMRDVVEKLQEFSEVDEADGTD